MRDQSVLILSYVFPPMSAVGGFRTARFAKYLPEFGWTSLVLAPSLDSLDPAELDPTLESVSPANAAADRARVIRPAVAAEDAVRVLRSWWRGLSAGANTAHDAPHVHTLDNEHGERRSWLRRAVRGALALAFEVPDEEIGWLFPAVKAGLSLIRRYRPQAIYSTGPPHSTHLIAVVLKVLSGLPLVIDLRDPWSRTEWKHRDNEFPRLQRWLEWLCVRGSDRVILNTPRLCEEFRQFYGARFQAKFVVISNGYDPALLPVADKLLARNAGARENGSICLCHPGNVYGERNLQCMAAAIARLNEAGWRVTLEQIGSVEHRFALLQYLRARQLESCFQIRGRLSHGETLARMAAADILLVLQPGTSIQVPGKLFEMLPFRKPLVALTGEGATADLIEQFGLGVVADPADSDAISSAILRAVNAHSCHSNGGRDQALAAFDGRRLTGELAQVLDGLA